MLYLKRSDIQKIDLTATYSMGIDQSEWMRAVDNCNFKQV